MSLATRPERTVFEISRAADFFTVAALRTQTGVSEDLWAAMCLKELVDNALDATEAAGIAPEITVSLERDGDDLRLTVGDNGPGLPPAPGQGNQAIAGSISGVSS
jgi:DNA topoisomerase VI subunit B